MRGKYKLADPGFACFKKKKAQDAGTAPQIRLHGGTDTYGAPEVYRTNAHQTIDVWSLACVFSMAATWVVLGFQGVCQYQLVRETALKSLLGIIKDDDHPLLQFLRVPARAKPQKVDCFHNGTEILREVAGWHSVLKNSTRRTDPITAAVIDLIGDRMLIQDPEKRIKSRELCTELKKLVAAAKKTIATAQSDEPVEIRCQRQHMENLLKGIDRDAAPQATEEQSIARTLAPAFVPGLPVNRSALKAHMSNLALKKTSHRFDTIPESRPGPISLGTYLGSPDVMVTGAEQQHGASSTKAYATPDSVSLPDRRKSTKQSMSSWRPSRASTFGQTTRRNTGISVLTHRPTESVARVRAPQNVIQARESIERKRARSAGLSVLGKKKLKKDDFLSKYFFERDIVSL